jgi:hypothetical protein
MSTSEIERFCRKAICQKQENKALVSVDGEIWQMHPRRAAYCFNENGLRTKLLCVSLYLHVSWY